MHIFIAFVCYQMDHIYLTLQLVQNAKTYVQANAQNLEIVENIVQRDGQRKYVKRLVVYVTQLLPALSKLSKVDSI